MHLPRTTLIGFFRQNYYIVYSLVTVINKNLHFRFFQLMMYMVFIIDHIHHYNMINWFFFSKYVNYYGMNGDIFFFKIQKTQLFEN